jgi:hypothetical protein
LRSALARRCGKLTACAACVAAALSLGACGGSGHGAGDVHEDDISSAAGTLSLNAGASIRQYTPGTALSIPVSVNGASGSSTVPLTVTSSDNTIAAVSPTTCSLSSGGSGNSCQVVVRAVAAGTATLTASAPGYDEVSITAVIGGSPPSKYDYGSVQIGAFPSATPPSTTRFAMTAQLGQVVTLQTSLAGFNQALNGVPILLSTTAGSLLGNPQCNVDSSADASHYCTYRVQLPSTAPAGNAVTVTAHVVGNAAGFQTWNAPTVTITTTANTIPGSIVLQSQDGTAPQGLSSPLWAVLQDSSGIGDTVVTLQASNANVTVNPGISASSGAYQTLSCTLSSANPVCGFGVKGFSSGATTISATASPRQYTIQPLALTVNAQLPNSRIVRFTNTRPSPIWVGITSGTSNSYATSALVSSVDPASGGPSKMCGPSDPAGGCSRGSTCQQGGANPNAGTTYFCYWDAPVPSNGYRIAAGATDTTSIYISQSSYDPVADITWSGNFFPREDCTLSSGGALTCIIADCGNASSGQACAPGTGGVPAVATLPEVTLQRYNTDYYDISIIGGATVAASFGPDSSADSPDSPVPAADGYSCGTAGAALAQGPLPAADWDMATHVNEPLVTGATLPFSETAQTSSSPSTAYYRLVSTVTPRQALQCSADTACTTRGYECGYDVNAVANGGRSDYQTSCGAHRAWLSGNAIWALNGSPSNAAPFKFQDSYSSVSGGAIQFNQLFTCTAPTVSGYDTSAQDSSLACGCTNWGDASLAGAPGDAPFISRIAAPSTPCAANNTVGASHPWTVYVLPTIAWLKRACPTCYTYPFDDMSSTFQCRSQATSRSAANAVPYVITFFGDMPAQ